LTGYDSTAEQQFDLTDDMIATLDDMKNKLGITDIQVGPNPDESISFYQYEVNFTTTKAGAFFSIPIKVMRTGPM